MIWESWYWRSDLLKQAESLRKRMDQKRWPDASLARCEQTVMLGCFSVRKLIESRKLTRQFAGRQVKIGVYPSTGKRVHLMNHRRLDKLYDFERAKDRTVTVEFLCNQIIHSYVFALFFDETNKFHSIAVASDRAKMKELFEVPITTIADLFERAGKGEGDDMLTYRYDAA